MEDMRSILMHQKTCSVVIVVSIACYVRPLIDDKYTRVTLAGQTLGKDASSEAGTDNQIIEHWICSSHSWFKPADVCACLCAITRRTSACISSKVWFHEVLARNPSTRTIQPGS